MSKISAAVDLASPKSIQWINDNDIDYVQAPYEAEQQLLDEDEKKASTSTEPLASSQCIDVEALKDERYEPSSIATIDDYMSCLVSGNNYMKELVVYNYDDDPLFQQPPPRDDCGVCMLELPINGQIQYQACCGKSLCGGCMRTHMLKANEKCPNNCGCAKCKKKRQCLCPYCRKPVSSSNAETIKRLRVRCEKHNDATAMQVLGSFYIDGHINEEEARDKAFTLWERAAELGNSAACGLMGDAYNPLWDNGRQVCKVKCSPTCRRVRDWRKSVEYYKKAAIGGNEQARFNLATLTIHFLKDHEAARRHYLIAATSGHDNALEKVKELYISKDVTKDEYANALRAHQRYHDGIKSDQRKVKVENNTWVSTEALVVKNNKGKIVAIK